MVNKEVDTKLPLKMSHWKKRGAALKNQLCFTSNVLGLTCDKSYALSLAMDKIKTTELLENLMKVIKETSVNKETSKIMDQEILVIEKRSLASQTKRNSTEKINLMAKKKNVDNKVNNIPAVSCQNN